MEPGFAKCPGKILIPSRRPAESRPLVEEPPAFFVAMPRTDAEMVDGGIMDWRIVKSTLIDIFTLVFTLLNGYKVCTVEANKRGEHHAMALAG